MANTIGFNVTNLADFVKSEGKVILTDIVLGADSFEYCTVQEGIKSSEKVLDVTEGTTVLQTGNYSGAWVGTSGNGFSGSTAMKDVTISVTQMYVKEAYQPQDIQKSVAQMAMKAGSNPEDLPELYKNAIMKIKGNSIKLKEDYEIWQGETSGSTYNKFNGFINQALNGGSTSAGTAVDLSAITGSTRAQQILDHVEKVYNAGISKFPQWVETDETIRMYMSPKNFDAHYRTVFKLQGTTQDALTLNKLNTIKEFPLPGTNVMITKIGGLNGKHNIIMGREGNFVVGCDLKSENEEFFKFEWLNESLIYRLMAVFKLGAKIVRGSEVVMTK